MQAPSNHQKKRSIGQGNKIKKQLAEQENIGSDEFFEIPEGHHTTRNDAKEKIKKIQGMKKRLNDNHNKFKNRKNFGQNKMSFQVSDKNMLDNSIDMDEAQRSKNKNHKNSKLIDYSKRIVKKEGDEDEGKIRIKYSTQNNYLRPKSAMKSVAATTNAKSKVLFMLNYFLRTKSRYNFGTY